MKVAPLIAVTLIICIAFPGSIQAKKKPKPNKFCIGKDGNQYAEGEGYDDNDGKACVHYKCVKKNKKKFIMKQGKCAAVDGEWGDWSSWSGCSATCGSAIKKRTRTCSNPKPSNGGKPCRGQDKEVEECSLKACGPVENVNVTAMELNLQSLNDTVQAMLELISTMQFTANKQGTCLSDLSSSECPASAAGKVGVVDGIAANTANISTNTAGLASSKAGIATNQAGIATNQAGVATNQAGVATNQAGVATNQAGVATNKAGVATNQAGVATNQVGVATNQAGVATNKEDITSNNDTCSSIQATATKIETCLGDVNSVSCPSSKGGKTSVPDAIMKNKDAVQNHHSDWTIIQRRGQYGNAEDYFYKDFKDYEDGFGSVDDELWIGLKKLAALTKDGEWELQVDLTDWDDKNYQAKYDSFSVGPAPTYKLHVGGFKDGESTLGDSMDYHDGAAFSARDKDQDIWSGSCAVEYQGGFWYKSCQHANLNGLNYAQQRDDYKGIRWYHGKDRGDGNKSWRTSVMKIKRVKV